MPLYEYACRDCGHKFEYLTRDGQSPACPSCDGQALDKLLSVFAVSANDAGTSSQEAVGPCGRMCGTPGACSMN
jgi:putative FmdB family regulatory protein